MWAPCFMNCSAFHITETKKMCSFSSSTDSVHILQGSSDESHPTSFGGACNFSNMEDEEDVAVKEEGFIAVKEEVDIGIKQEEIPEDITFPDIKSEPDESNTDSLHILPGPSSESHATSSGGVSNFSNMEVEEDVDVIEVGLIAINEEAHIGVKQELIPEDINFPDIKAESNEYDATKPEVIEHMIDEGTDCLRLH